MRLQFVSPYPNELLSSWLIRTAIDHGCTPLTLTYAIWGNSWRPWTVDMDLNISDDRLIPLLSNTLSLQQIKKLTLKGINQRINGDSEQLRRWITKLGVRNLDRTGGLKFCPLCLLECGYIKQQWRVVWNVYCEIHNVLLQSHCEQCSLAFSPHKISFDNLNVVYCPRCRGQLSKQVYKFKILEIKAIQKNLNVLLLQDESQSTAKELREILGVYGFFLRFVNSASLIRSTADQRLLDRLELNLNKKNNIKEGIEKMPSEWMIELFKIVILVREKSVSDLAMYFNELGYTQQSFISRLPAYKFEFLQNFLSLLPSNPRKSKCINKGRLIETIHPLPREEVLEKWELLKKKMK